MNTFDKDLVICTTFAYFIIPMASLKPLQNTMTVLVFPNFGAHFTGLQVITLWNVRSIYYSIPNTPTIHVPEIYSSCILHDCMAMTGFVRFGNYHPYSSLTYQSRPLFWLDLTFSNSQSTIQTIHVLINVNNQRSSGKKTSRMRQIEFCAL